MKVPIIAALICLYPAFAQTAVNVRVVNSVTKAPLAGANVTIESAKSNQTYQLAGRTDRNGVFAGSVAFAGSYLLTTGRTGYRMTGTGLMGKMVEIQTRQANEITVEMLPLGLLSGRVLDQYGDPVRHAIVSTLAKSRFPLSGEDFESLFAATTDDLGEYKITDVEPGTYYLVIEYSASDEQHYAPRSRYQWPEFGGLALFPDAADIEHARHVEVHAGETMRLSDAHLTMQRALTISGRIKPAQTDHVIVSVQRAGPRLSRHQSMMMSSALAPDGTFHVEVLPGIYIVRASSRSGITPTLTIDAHDKTVTGLELTLGQAYEISGRIVVDGMEHLDFSKLTLHFFNKPVEIDTAGAFHTVIGNGEAGYMMQGLPADWYVKGFRVGGRSIEGKRFQVEPGTTEVVLTLNPKGARVEIATEGANDSKDTMQATMVALLPESGIVDADSMLSAERGADPSGKFVLRGVPPGDYRVFSLDASNWALLFRPDVLLEKYRKLAPLVKVAEGEHKKIVVPSTKIPVE